MAGDCGLEVEEALRGQRRHRAAHREAVTDRHDADIGLMQFVDQAHVGKDIRVAHVKQRSLVIEMQHQAVRVPERMGNAVLGDRGGRVQRIGEGDGEAFHADRAARIARRKVLQALVRQPHAEIEVGNHGRTGVSRDLQRIADMVAVAVCQEDMGDVLGGILGVKALKARIAGEEGVDQDFGLGRVEAEGGMAEPGNFHGRSP